jgi:hypothetical protein
MCKSELHCHCVCNCHCKSRFRAVHVGPNPILTLVCSVCSLSTGGIRYKLPPHIRLDPCKTVQEVLQSVDPANPKNNTAAMKSHNKQQVTHHLLQITSQLDLLLQAAHQSNYVLRDIKLDNVVFTQLHAQQGWTLLELGHAHKATHAVRYNADSLSCHMVPPEVCYSHLHGKFFCHENWGSRGTCRYSSVSNHIKTHGCSSGQCRNVVSLPSKACIENV